MTDWDAADRGYDAYQDHKDRLQHEREEWEVRDLAPAAALGPRCWLCKSGRCGGCRGGRHCSCTHQGASSVEPARPVLDGSGVPVRSPGTGPRTFDEAGAR